MRKVLLVLCAFFACALVVYAGANRVGSYTVTNTVVASGNSSAITAIPVGFDMKDFKTVTGVVIVEPSVTTLRGYGLADTCDIVLKTSLGSDVIAVDSTWKAGLPCTAFVAVPSVIGDTAFKQDAYIYIRIADSSADSTFTAEHKVKYYLTAR